MSATIDLNVDAGESFGAWTMGDDAALFAAGDEREPRLRLPRRRSRARSARASPPALAAGVAVGAHPGLPDLPGFGRRALALTPQEVHDDTLYQVGALAAFVRAAGATLHHVKPHGALNTAVAESSDAHAEAIVEAVRAFDADVPVVAIAGSRLHRACERLGHPFVAEGFPDRGYAPDGSLAPRRTAGAIIHDPELAAARAVRMVLAGHGRGARRHRDPLEPGTLCIHGDNPGSVATARAIRAALEREGVAVAAF